MTADADSGEDRDEQVVEDELLTRREDAVSAVADLLGQAGVHGTADEVRRAAVRWGTPSSRREIPAVAFCLGPDHHTRENDQ